MSPLAVKQTECVHDMRPRVQHEDLDGSQLKEGPFVAVEKDGAVNSPTNEMHLKWSCFSFEEFEAPTMRWKARSMKMFTVVEYLRSFVWTVSMPSRLILDSDMHAGRARSGSGVFTKTSTQKTLEQYILFFFFIHEKLHHSSMCAKEWVRLLFTLLRPKAPARAFSVILVSSP